MMRNRQEKYYLLLVVEIALLLASSNAIGNETASGPKLHYYNWGACPFECCTYRQWTAKEDVVIRKEIGKDAPVIFSVRNGENVQALTGVVITRKPGKIRINRPVTLGSKEHISLKPGDIIYSLHYLGEGFSKYWYRGKVYEDQIASNPSADSPFKTLSTPETEWWVKIQNGLCRIGWTDQHAFFAHKDACE